MQHRELKDKLPHTWDALFGRFGRFTGIQALAIDPLLDGNNCVLVSATASGKTEAVLAPLIELNKLELTKRDRKAPEKLSILYILPTRALARDLARRLEQPLDKLAVRMRVKTGDEPAFNAHRPPELLLTTPESFDSLLTKMPRIFKDVRAVVIDELHIFDNTVRGDQLRILLNRLRRLKHYALSRGDVASEAIQYCALSATINDPANIAARYFVNPQIIEFAGQRAIDAELIELEGTETIVRLFAGLKQRGYKKVLAFCTSRAECEEWAYRLRPGSPFGGNVYVHHASLAASVRRAVEKHFAQAEAALCFATSTLELGIDIGDVDLVLLIGAPGDQSAFLQRIGRGNRRRLRTAVACCYRNAMEHALFQVFIRAVESGVDIDASRPYVFRPSVVVQQLCSYIKQTRLGEIDPGSAYELFITPEGTPLIPRAHYDQIIEHLLVKQFFVAVQENVLKPGPAWQELFEQRAIYTNLLDPRRSTVEVVAEETGRKMGEIDRTVLPGVDFLFGGEARQARRMVGRKLIVRTTETETAAQAPRLFTPWRPLSPALTQAVADELGVPRASDPSHLAMVIESEDEAESTIPGAPITWLFHCGGDAYGLILGDLLESLYRVRVDDCNNIYVVVKGTIPTESLEFTIEQVRSRLRQRWRQMESWYNLGRFQSALPLDVRRASVIESFDVTGFMRAFKGRRVAIVENTKQTIEE